MQNFFIKQRVPGPIIRAFADPATSMNKTVTIDNSQPIYYAYRTLYKSDYDPTRDGTDPISAPELRI